VDGGRSFDIELITPMFGGGVETRANDPSFPIRPTAIRGQLQFWWRATVGARYPTREELRAAQSAIWGSTEHASRVQVLVENVQASAPVPCAKIKPNHKGKDQVFWEPPFQFHKDSRDDSLPYALFPFQGKPADEKGPQVDPACCIVKLSFQLILRCPDNLWPQVEPAVWAWANFGGMGSRTRRGCGAVLCKVLAPRDQTHLAEQMNKYVPQQPEVRDWPTIGEGVLLRTVDPPGDPIGVWDWLIGLFKHFRQGVGFARNPGQPPNRPGRSHYPEPETIRRVTGQRSGQHARIGHVPDDAFPRAELGLPIVFHYQGQGEPPDTVLYPSDDAQGKKRERMASPLILKPLAHANGKALPLIMHLKAPPLTGVDLRRGETSLSLPEPTLIRDPQLASYPHSPLTASPNGSALEAFLAFARTKGFTEEPG
jgi:CRISPR-associated protein Cmr1